MFTEQSLDGFRLHIAPGVSGSWVGKIIRGLDTLPRANRAHHRRMGLVNLPFDSSSGSGFVKVYHHTSPRHQKWRRRAPIQRLRRRYADHEGQALRHLDAAGVPVPGLLFYGEEWRLGIRHRGVVVSQAVTGPTLFEVLNRRLEDRWLEAYPRLLARIHESGLSHGDAYSRNFLVDRSRLMAIDLENSRPLTRKKRSSDLVAMISSIHRATGLEDLAMRSLDSYISVVGEASSISTGALLKRGLTMATENI